jgi:outer membrane protein assembly factor BamE (lipoprotein component of BamABCDE complex)
MKPSALIITTAAICLALLTGCVEYQSKRGVEVTWQPSATDQLVKGSSTRKDVLDMLGPPSQVISLEDETVLYYLFERSQGDGVILIVYNRVKIDTRYDRAIFFFDGQDVLTDFATRFREPEQG